MAKNQKIKNLPKNPNSIPDRKMLVVEHLRELRRRLLVVFLCILVFTSLGYLIHDRLILELIRPLDSSLVYNSPAGGLDFILKISMMFGIFCSTPVIFYQGLKFLAPALPNKYTKKIVYFLLFSIIVLLIGASFAFWVALPSALYFLSQFGTENIDPLISTEAYLDFLSIYLIGFGLIFQLPLVIFFINYINPLDIHPMIKKFKYVVLASFIFAAILTPTPDVVNQLIMALPIISLYGVSIIMVWLFNKNNKTST